MESIKISIIIVTYHSRDLILDSIHSIYQYNDLNNNEIEVIVVDNSNEEEHRLLKNLINEKISHEVNIIHNPANGGYGQGNNVGAITSKGDFLAIMNPDVRLQEPLFNRMLKHFEDEKVASVGFQQVTGNLNYSFFQRPEFFLPIYTSLYTKFCNKKGTFIEKEFYLSGAFVFFRKADFFQIGMYDERMFMYLEEPDVAKRINEIKKISVFDPSKKYIHLMEQKDDFNEWLLDVGTDSIKIYFQKYKFNLRKFINLRIMENKIFIFIFSISRNKQRVAMARAYINSLNKANC